MFVWSKANRAMGGAWLWFGRQKGEREEIYRFEGIELYDAKDCERVRYIFFNRSIPSHIISRIPTISLVLFIHNNLLKDI